jgi:integrase-like protein
MPDVKFLDQVREQLRLSIIPTVPRKHTSIKRFTLRVFHNKRHPIEMGDPEIRAFLLHLVEKEQVAASTHTASAASAGGTKRLAQVP